MGKAGLGSNPPPPSCQWPWDDRLKRKKECALIQSTTYAWNACRVKDSETVSWTHLPLLASLQALVLARQNTGPVASCPGPSGSCLYMTDAKKVKQKKLPAQCASNVAEACHTFLRAYTFPPCLAMRHVQGSGDRAGQSFEGLAPPLPNGEGRRHMYILCVTAPLVESCVAQLADGLHVSAWLPSSAHSPSSCALGCWCAGCCDGGGAPGAGRPSRRYSYNSPSSVVTASSRLLGDWGMAMRGSVGGAAGGFAAAAPPSAGGPDAAAGPSGSGSSGGGTSSVQLAGVGWQGSLTLRSGRCGSTYRQANGGSIQKGSQQGPAACLQATGAPRVLLPTTTCWCW
eukprot:365417-Chlamydomonas_euryale.AAC.18